MSFIKKLNVSLNMIRAPLLKKIKIILEVNTCGIKLGAKIFWLWYYELVENRC